MAQLKLMGMDIHQLLTTAATMDMRYMVQNPESVNMMEAGMAKVQCADQREVS